MSDLARAIGFVPPADWPARTRAECHDYLTAPGARFEMDTVDIRGVPTRVWKNAPANLRQVAMVGRAHGERLFAIYEDERVTYDAWFRAVAQLAGELRARGVEKGDRVALAMRNLPEWPVAFFAATTIGAICVLVDRTRARLRPGQFGRQAAGVRCRALGPDCAAPGRAARSRDRTGVT
jgi:long-chain acyl-CoA synthetase